LSRHNPLVSLPDNEFDRLPGEDQRTAIIFAADCCSQTWADYHGNYNALERWRINRKWSQWRTAIMGADYPAAIEAWRNYRMAGSASFPQEEMPSPDGNFRYFGQPELASILNFLTITCGLMETQAFDYPLGMARMRRLAWLESEGGGRIQNAIEKEIARRRDEYFKAHPEPEFELLNQHDAGPNVVN